MALIKETSYNGMARCGLVNTLMYTLPHMRVYSYSCMSTRREVTLARALPPKTDVFRAVRNVPYNHRLSRNSAFHRATLYRFALSPAVVTSTPRSQSRCNPLNVNVNGIRKARFNEREERRLHIYRAMKQNELLIGRHDLTTGHKNQAASLYRSFNLFVIPRFFYYYVSILS